MSDGDPTNDEVQIVVGADEAGKRLDVFLAKRFPTHSRVQLRCAIVAGTVSVDGRRTKVAYRLVEGETVQVRLPELPVDGPEPEDIPLDILYEDEHLVAVNKPANMVVHPAKGHWQGTLVAGLAFHFQQLSSVGGTTRPGIVHRLDRDTTGVMVVAKTNTAHLKLASQFEARTVEKEYLAIVAGSPEFDRDWIDQPIGNHPHHREKMAIRANHSTSREAKTFYEVVERHHRVSLVRAQPKTGRTHQIRIHLGHIGCPVLCDAMYGGRRQVTEEELLRVAGKESANASDRIVLERQALHAHSLRIDHPVSRERLTLSAPVPPDMQDAIDLLQRV